MFTCWQWAIVAAFVVLLKSVASVENEFKVEKAVNAYAIIEPPENPPAETLSGGLLEVQVNNDRPDPTQYDALITSCTYGPTSPMSSFIFNSPFNFSVPNNIRGDCTVRFNAESAPIGTRPVVVYAPITIASIYNQALAGSTYYFNATSVYSAISDSNPFTASIFCTEGSTDATINVNTGEEQSVYIPDNLSGTCSFANTASILTDSYKILPFQFNIAEYQVIEPTDSPSVQALSGGTFVIQADNAEATPTSYDAQLIDCLYGGPSQIYTFTFNSSSNFSVPLGNRGYCTVKFSQSSLVFGSRPVNVYAPITISTNSDPPQVEAGSNFFYNATTEYTGPAIPNPIGAAITCTVGDRTTLLNVNTGTEQSFLIPADFSGTCTMTSGAGASVGFYSIIPFEFQILSLITIEVLSPSSNVPFGSTVTLLVAASGFRQVQATLTLTCSVGGSQSQAITTAGDMTDYTYFALNPALAGTCVFSLTGYPDTYTPNTASISFAIPARLYYFPMDKLIKWPRIRGMRRFRITST